MTPISQAAIKGDLLRVLSILQDFNEILITTHRSRKKLPFENQQDCDAISKNLNQMVAIMKDISKEIKHQPPNRSMNNFTVFKQEDRRIIPHIAITTGTLPPKKQKLSRDMIP